MKKPKIKEPKFPKVDSAFDSFMKDIASKEDALNSDKKINDAYTRFLDDIRSALITESETGKNETFEEKPVTNWYMKKQNTELDNTIPDLYYCKHGPTIPTKKALLLAWEHTRPFYTQEG